MEVVGQESSDIEGSGPGLVIARQLVGAMGGELTLTGGPASGAVGLPAPAAPPSTPGLRMLYVEDNRINAILFEEAMRIHGGIDLRVAEDGAEALSLAQTWQPEVLVLDANLPDMSGYDVLQRLRALPDLATVPAYMCSADAMADDRQRARAAGFVGYWTKPIDVARVLSDLSPLLPAGAPGTA